MMRAWFAWAVVGVLAASTVAALVPVEATPREELAFQIPIGRIGDTFSYRGYVEQWSSWRPNQTNGANFDAAFTVAAITTAFDRTLHSHRVVEVRNVRNVTALWHSEYEGADFIDLETRHVIRVDEITKALTWDYENERIELGPVMEQFYNYRMGLWMTTFGPAIMPFLGTNDTVAYQGRLLRPGTDLGSDLPAVDRAALEAGETGAWAVALRGHRFAHSVASTSELGGRTAVSVQRSLDIDYTTWVPDQVSVATKRIPRDWTDRQETTIWLAADVPYPIRLERTFSRMGEAYAPGRDFLVNHTVILELTEYRPGTEPIPWGTPDGVPHFVTENPMLERAGDGARHPTDGSSPRWPFRLEAAVAHVASDPTLVQFQQWRERHPNARLFGLDYSRSQPGDPLGARQRGDVDTWQLIYGWPGVGGAEEQLFVVTSSRNRTTGLVQNVEWGAGRLPAGVAFGVEDLPSSPVSFAAIDRLWMALRAGPEAREPPDSMTWGCLAHYSTTTNPNRFVGPTRAVTVRCAPDWLRWASVGRYFAEYGVRPNNEPMKSRPMWDFVGNGITVDLETGEVTSLGAYGMRFEFLPLPYEARSTPVGDVVRPPPALAAQLASAPDEIPIQRALMATATLLIVLAVAYLYPMMKFLGAQAVAFLPGYAKLRRSQLLNHPTRDQLVQLVRQEPGISPPELHRRIGGGWTTLVYHLRVLEKNKVVSSMLDGRHRRFFPTDSVDWGRRGALAALRNERTRSLYEIIEQEPGVFQGDLVRRLGVTAPAVRWHLERLEQTGLIASERTGRKMAYFPHTAPSPIREASGIEVA